MVLALVAVCVAFSVASKAQTYTKNFIYTIAGGGPVATTTLSAQLPGPTGAIMDSSGNLYIAAPPSAYVFKATSAGAFSVLTGKGYGGYGGDGKAYSGATVSTVVAFAFDAKGNLYFADAGGSRIRAINFGSTAIKVAGVTINPGTIATVAGNGIKCDHAAICGDGGLATSANLNLPESIVLDAAGNIYIADSVDNRIRVVNVGTSAVTIATVNIPAGDIQTVAGQGTPCSSGQSACGDGGVATAAFLNSPYGVALDSSGNIYIADTYDHKIREVLASTGIISTVAGNGIGCTNPASGCGDGKLATSGELRQPRGVTVDGSGNLYIADTLNNRIREVVGSTGIISTLVDKAGTQGFLGDGGSALSAQIDLPTSVYLTPGNNLLIADTGNQRIRFANQGGSAVMIAGVTVGAGNIATVSGGGMGGDGGSPTKALLATPYDVAEDAAGSLYIVDQANNRVRKITNPTLNSAIITTVAGTGSSGYSGDGEPATSATLNAPTSIAFDSSGNLYIADSGNLVIREVSASTGNISTVFGNGNSCFPTTNSCGDGGGPLGASFALPFTVTLDSANNVYVSDWSGQKIREWNISTGLVTTVAGSGISGRRGDGGLATLANLSHPAGLAVDSQNNIYISDQFNGVVRQVCRSSSGIYCLPLSQSGNIYTWALNGNAKLSGNGGPKLNGSMWNPLMLAIDPSQNIYISGGNDDTVQRISQATGIYSNIAGNPSSAIVGGFSGDKGSAVLARMSNLGAVVDGLNNLYIADGGNNRIRYVPLAPAASVSASTLPLGQWALGSAGSPVPLKVSGAGGMDLSLSGFSFTGTNAGDVSQTNNCGTLPALLSPQSSCTVQLTLTPSVYGPETAKLQIADNAAGSPQLVTLTGSGPDFTIADSPASVTVTAGSSGQTTVTLTPEAKFNQSITLTCPSGLPSGSTCSFSLNPVPMPGGSAQTSTLTIQTSASTPTGSYLVTTTGTYGTLAHPTTFTLVVQ
jgi:sugar lactone lactonase YvrE